MCPTGTTAVFELPAWVQDHAAAYHPVAAATRAKRRGSAVARTQNWMTVY